MASLTPSGLCDCQDAKSLKERLHGVSGQWYAGNPVAQGYGPSMQENRAMRRIMTQNVSLGTQINKHLRVVAVYIVGYFEEMHPTEGLKNIGFI